MSKGTDIGGRDTNAAAKEIYATMEKGLDQPAEDATDVKPFHFMCAYGLCRGETRANLCHRVCCLCDFVYLFVEQI